MHIRIRTPLSRDIALDSESARRVAAKRLQRRRVPPLRYWLLSGVLLLSLLLTVAGWALFSYEQYFTTRIYPNISVHGVGVGQMPPAEAAVALREHYSTFLERPVTLTYGDQEWTPTLAELGIQIDFDAAVAEAMHVGRSSNREETLRAVTAVSLNGYTVPLHLEIDQPTLQRYLLAHVGTLEHPATDAQLWLDGARLLEQAATPGTQVLIDQTMQDIIAAVQSFEPQTVPVRTRPLPSMLSDEAVASARQEISTLLQAPLQLHANGSTWEWTRADLARIIQIERVADPHSSYDTLAVNIHEDLLRRRIEHFAAVTEIGGVYPRVNWDGGNLTIFQAGTPGSRVDEEQAFALISEALWQSERTVELPFRDVPVPTTSAELAQLGLNELISVGTTSFEDSEDYRVTNIVSGMRLLHGHLLAPGEEFSFNNTVQSIGPENGFVQGYAIVDEETQLEWGGGICQDSTTMFRAAFWAGLPITERWNHSRYISWYDPYGYGPYGNGPGLDSTIFLGGPDLRFVNDTGNWILIQAWANPQSEIAEVRFYGTKGGRSVEFGGAHTSWLSGGRMEVAFTRIIKQDGVEVNRRTYWSTYDPW